MAATTKQTGSGHLMWPEGKNVETISNDLFLVIEHSLRIISWQENLPSDECPPAWMWHLDWELETWFDKIKKDRENKYGTSSSSSNDDNSGAMFEENVYFERMKESL